jgi:hypothetical protein
VSVLKNEEDQQAKTPDAKELKRGSRREML